MPRRRHERHFDESGLGRVSCPYALPIPNAIPMTTRAAILRDMTFSFASLLHPRTMRDATPREGQRSCRRAASGLFTPFEAFAKKAGRIDRDRSCRAHRYPDARCVMPHRACVFDALPMSASTVDRAIHGVIALHRVECGLIVRFTGGRFEPHLVHTPAGPARGGVAAARMAWTRLRIRPLSRLGWATRVAVPTESVSPGIHFAHLFPTVMMGIAVYFVSRTGVLSPKRLLDLGLVFEVAGAFGIAAGRSGPAFPNCLMPHSVGPGECVWIVAYPLVVPNTPHKVLAASMLAASMGPAVFAMASPASGISCRRFGGARVYVLPNFLSAAIAYAAAHIVHRFGVRLKHAREIGSYELIGRLGEGGMGEVWRAKHRLLARPAAIKLIRTQVLGSSQRTRDAMVRRFEREAQETAMLGSPHTIDVYDFGVNEEGDFYYVMERSKASASNVSGQVFGPMESGRAVYLLRQICHSLGEAHSRGLIHRDIKPANIFMCRLGLDDHRKGARFRPRQACGLPAGHDADDGGLNSGHARVHGARNCARPPGHRWARRHLLAGLCRVFLTHRTASVRSRHCDRDGSRARQR